MNRRTYPLTITLGLIAVATLLPASGDAWPRQFWCMPCATALDPTELLANVLLFVPLGFVLRASGVRVAWGLAIILGTTLTIEVLQYFVIIGREGSIRDVIINTIGGIAGFTLQPGIGAVWRADRKPSRRLAWGGALVWIANAALTSILFRPANAPAPRFRYFGQIAPQLGNRDTFAGSVLSATVDGSPLLDGRMDLRQVETVMRPDTLSLTSVVVPGHRSSRLAPIVAVVAHAYEVAIIGQLGDAVLFQAHVAGQNLGFNAPAVVLDGALGDAARQPGAAPISLVGTRRALEQRIVATYANGASHVATLTLSPSLGWALWWESQYPDRATMTWMTVLWLAVPVGLITFWAASGDGRSRGVARSFAPSATAVVGAHVLVPLVFGGAQIASWPEGIALVTGAVLGLLAGRLRSSARDVSLGAPC